MPAVARLDDTSSHGGKIVSGDLTVLINGKPAARQGSLHQCPISGHGTTPLTSIATKSNLITVGATAGCGAVINSGSPNVNAA